MGLHGIGPRTLNAPFGLLAPKTRDPGFQESTKMPRIKYRADRHSALAAGWEGCRRRDLAQAWRSSEPQTASCSITCGSPGAHFAREVQRLQLPAKDGHPCGPRVHGAVRYREGHEPPRPPNQLAALAAVAAAAARRAGLGALQRSLMQLGPSTVHRKGPCLLPA